MIAGLRKKFILISAVSVLAVFSVIFLLLALFSWDQTARTMDTLTDAIASNDGVFPEFDPADRTGPIRGLPYGEVINEETRFSTRFFTAWLDREGEILRVNVDAISSIALTLTLDNENVREIQIRLCRYDGEQCLAVVDGQPVSLVPRSSAVDLIEAINAIVL